MYSARMVLWLVLSFGWASAGLAEPLRLVGDVWPPFTDVSLPSGGLAKELVVTVLQRAGYASEYVQVPWARVLRGLRADDYDVVVSAWYDPERAEYGLFSDPYLINRLRFFQRREAGIHFERLPDLYTYSIAVVRGYAYEQAFDRDTQLLKVPVVDFAMAVRMLAAGRLDLAVEDERVAQYHLQRELKGLGELLEPLPHPLSENGLHILVRRDHPQAQRIVEDFNRTLKDMRADGSYAAIFKRHGLASD
ncbi:transporter substrate-binding domain-containing protein [Pseudomonas sp. RIT-PI-AD]|uniref:substrate-binding periplasmic protein n=1 Tax=Pseudomonas sp. RIT-PI-AD TaxID=3035294 RepID=UPI0021D87503|nr:transporter substrate-binding domain-containing protein [Pseudomonas sp. RIT-PI-AD]